ncbi:MAG: hypothetical protein V4813_16885 [Gemmatimonadota bacterium]
MEPMQRLERTIKVIVAMISLVGLSFIGLRVYASRSRIGLPDPPRECAAVGRTYDSTTRTCLPAPRRGGQSVPVTP